MTTQAPVAPKKKRPPIDVLLKLAEEDIPREQARLKALSGRTDVTPDRLLVEMHSTVLDITKDLARGLVEVRDWAYSYMNGISDHLEATDLRLDAVEDFGGDSMLLPDDAEVLMKVAVGARYLATQLLQGPFPIEERDDDGKQKLAELIAYAEQAERLIGDAAVVIDEDEDDDDDDDADADATADSDEDQAN